MVGIQIPTVLIKYNWYLIGLIVTLFQVQLLTPHPGWVEIDPEGLWTSVVKVVHNAIEGLFKFIVKCPGDLNELGLWTESRGHVTVGLDFV